MNNENKITRCRDCNSIVYEDGTAANCAGECEREAYLADDYRPLDFERDEVLRDLPDFEDLQPAYDDIEAVEDAAGDPADI